MEPEFIIFDNVFSLTVGNMKETEAERALRPFRKRLTQRSIGQLWLHHTGHDTGRVYGDSTRQWALDTVMLMKDKRPTVDSDIRFDLTFQKARRRSEATRASYKEVEMTLAPNLVTTTMARVRTMWAHKAAEVKLTGPRQHILDTLQGILGGRATREELEAACDPKKLAPDGKHPKAVPQALKRGLDWLTKNGHITEAGGRHFALQATHIGGFLRISGW
jgi:hypothetical protein